MMSRPMMLALGAGCILPLAACGPSAAPAPTATETATAGVTREEVLPETPAPTMAPAAVIQSQPGPQGAQLDLVKVAVTGDILTVTLRCSGPDAYHTETFKVKDISLIDDATSQRISVLKDNDGNAMVSNPSGDYLSTQCAQKPGVIWAKFPAPPATSKTISINFPQVAPFDGVPVTR